MATHDSTFQHLALEFVRVTELAAIAAAKWIGRGEKELADKAAVDAMREILNQINFSGEIVIGEGAKDESYELFIGEKVGTGIGPTLDIAVDPLECTSSVAFGRPNALTVIATGPKDTLYKAIDSYMQKIAVGPKARNVIDLDAPVKDNIAKVASALGKDISEITVAVLDRPKHENLVKEIREAGARTQLFTDGDIAMAIASCMDESSVDMLLGIGGSTEAVLTAVALKCLDGEILCRWKPKNEDGIKLLQNAGITDFNKVFSRDDLAKGNDLAFTASGVITGPILEGVVFGSDHITTHTIVMSSGPKMVRFIKTVRNQN